MLGCQVKSGGDCAPYARWRREFFILLHHNFNCMILPQMFYASEKRPFPNLIENGRFIAYVLLLIQQEVIPLTEGGIGLG